MNYIDIFVCAVPTANRELYLEHAKATTAIFKSHGVLKVIECWGDDVPEAIEWTSRCPASENEVIEIRQIAEGDHQASGRRQLCI